MIQGGVMNEVNYSSRIQKINVNIIKKKLINYPPSIVHVYLTKIIC